MEVTAEYYEPVFEQLMKRGNSLAESAEPGTEQDDLQARLSETEARWKTVRDRNANQLHRIKALSPEAKRYRDTLDTFLPWLTETELKLASFQLAVPSLNSIDEQKHAVDLVRKDIDQHRVEGDELDLYAKTLINQAEADIHIVEEEAKQTTERYAKLNAAYVEKEKMLGDVMDDFSRYYSYLQPLNKVLSEVDAALQAQEPISADLDNMREEMNKIEVWSPCSQCAHGNHF